MARKKQQVEFVRGSASHRRTEGDYMGVLLEAVTLEDWRTVVNSAKSLAQDGDAQARSWLAQYLMGKPEGKAPSPLTVVVQQLNGADPVVSKLAAPAIHQAMYPSMHSNDDYEAHIRAMVATELQEKVKQTETIGNPATMRVDGEVDANHGG